MENERKTLAEVTEQYQTDLARMKREIGALKGLVSEDLEKSSFMDRISKYEDEISKLNDKIREQVLLYQKIPSYRFFLLPLTSTFFFVGAR